MKSLSEIVVRVNRDIDDPRHIEITVDSVVGLAMTEDPTLAAYGSPTNEQLVDNAFHVAGILGRLGLTAAEILIMDRREHRCPTYPGDVECSIGGDGFLNPLDPIADRSPGLWIDVPTERESFWLERIEAWLTEIARSAMPRLAVAQ
jgi:hypothetical protein